MTRSFRVITASIPITVLTAVWIVWTTTYGPLLDDMIAHGTVLDDSLKSIDNLLASGRINETDAIDRLKEALVGVQRADAELVVSLKSGLLFLFLALVVGVLVGTAATLAQRHRRD